MKTLNPNTKKAKAFIEAYMKSTNHTLNQVYGRFSQKKFNAYRECKYICFFFRGYDFRIISWNTFQFTCGWRYGYNLRVETRDNSYIIPNAF